MKYYNLLIILIFISGLINTFKYPWFLDLEERYGDPSDHDWNYDYDENQYITADDYPEPARKRWLRLFDRGCDDDE